MNAFELIPNDTRSLLQSQPGHKVYRSMARAATGYKLPDDCQSYDAIVAWYTAKEIQKPAAPPTPSLSARIEVPVEGSYTELGRCDYASQYTYGSVGISARDLANLINDSASLEDFIEAFREYIYCDQPYDADSQGTDYSDYESSDIDNHEVSFDTARLVEQLRQFAIAQGINLGVLAGEGDELEEDDEDGSEAEGN